MHDNPFPMTRATRPVLDIRGLVVHRSGTVILDRLDWRVQRPFRVHDRWRVIPSVEMFNTLNNANNVNPLTTPALFNFDGFLRQGVGDPRQVQLAVKVTF